MSRGEGVDAAVEAVGRWLLDFSIGYPTGNRPLHPSFLAAAERLLAACRAELLDALTEEAKPYFTAPLIIKGEVIGHTSFYNAPADQPLLVPALVAREAPDAR